MRIGELTRDDALQEIANPLYEPDALARDKRYVCKKLGFTEEEFDGYMAQPPRSHADFASDQSYIRPLFAAGRKLKAWRERS